MQCAYRERQLARAKRGGQLKGRFAMQRFDCIRIQKNAILRCSNERVSPKSARFQPWRET